MQNPVGIGIFLCFFPVKGNMVQKELGVIVRNPPQGPLVVHQQNRILLPVIDEHAAIYAAVLHLASLAVKKAGELIGRLLRPARETAS